MGGEIITLLVLSSIVVILGFAIGTLILFRWMKLQKKKEEEMQKKGQNGRSSPLIDCNDALKV
ncbi:hypothetical protein B566_EDAN013576 [Ephemera danica]|nr:hypothetical protein B566_EDAN013576 [Ephemera danica]